MTPHLEYLYLEGCNRLQDIHAPVGCLKYILELDLNGCLNFLFDRINRLCGLGSLKLEVESVDICGVHPNSNLPKFRFKCELQESATSSSGNFEKLISFGLCACTNFDSFSATICSLQQLGMLKLEGSMPEVPKDMYRLQSLETLTLSMKEIKYLPDSICMLKNLISLDLSSCLLLERLPDDLGRLEGLQILDLTDCYSLREIPDSICSMKCLTHLHLLYCFLVEKLPEELGRMECLKELNIEGACITRLPQSIYQSKGLRIIGYRSRLMSYGFTSLTDISAHISSCFVYQHDE